MSIQNSQKNIVIIGGTSGIGLSTGKHLSYVGHNVILAGRTDPNVSFGKYQYIDVTLEESVKEFFNTLGETKIDGVVYSTGITAPKAPIEKFDKNNWNKLLNTNVTGALLVMKYAYKGLASSRGRVVFVNSIAARSFSAFSCREYTMTKCALSGLARELSIELSKDGILVNSVFPSMTDSPMLREALDSQKIKSIEGVIPLKRIAQPEEIAKAIEFLIGSNNTYMTGASIDLNGGQFLTS